MTPEPEPGPHLEYLEALREARRQYHAALDAGTDRDKAWRELFDATERAYQSLESALSAAG